MMRALRPLALLIALVAALAAMPAAALADEPPAPTPLTEGWEYRPDPEDQGRYAGWKDGVRQEAWTPVSVPHIFDARPLDYLFGGSIGWYRVRFEPPSPPAGFGWGLRFEGVRRTARVWLNGVEQGFNEDPYTPFTLPLSGLRPGEPDELVVRVENRKAREPREGWWNWGGIVRPVALVPLGRIAVQDLGLLPKLDCHAGPCTATVLADMVLWNRSGAQAAPQIDVTLKAPSGTVTEKTTAVRPLAVDERERVRFSVPVQGTPDVWSPDRPQLYEATVRARLGDGVTQVERLRIGLRSVRVRHGLLYLNGRRVALRGASIQEDVPDRGPALGGDDVEQIVAGLKSVGANVTRAHYLLNERLLDRFDEEGILVWSQAPVYHRDRGLRTLPGRAAALGTLRRTILAARNHPSVLTHSVANELSPAPDDLPTTRDWLTRAAAAARDLDPTLPVALDLLSYPGFPRQRTYEAFDLLGINNYFGWYPGKPDHSTAKLADLRPYLASMRRKYPRHAMVMTEFGAEATFDGPWRVKETYAFQARYLRRTLDIVDQTPWLGGAIYWTLREFAVKPAWDGGARRSGITRDAIHNKGLLAYDGRPKPAWDVARQRFRSVALYRR